MYRPNSIVIAIVLYHKKIMIWVCCNLQITKTYDHRPMANMGTFHLSTSSILA